jgi:RNA polymerase sigma-70 factor (ECF subfamily)
MRLGVRPVYGESAAGARCLADQAADADSPARPDPGAEPSDENLLEKHLNGDPTAFDRLVRRYERGLFHFLIRFLGNRSSAEDVFQEAFLQVHQSARSFDLSRRFRPWLFTIAANKARDLMRSQSRRPTSPLQAEISGEGSGTFIDLMAADIPEPIEPLKQEEVAGRVQGVVMGMPDNLREVLLLSYFHQFPYKQIADILEIPLGTVKSRLHSAVATFADRWQRATGETANGSAQPDGGAATPGRSRQT